MSPKRVSDSETDFLSFLDSDPRVAERKYRMIRARLVFFFLQRRCPDPEDLADEVVLRAHRRLREGADVTCELMTFCHGIAVNVYREQRLPPVEFDEKLHTSPFAGVAVSRDNLILVQQCLGALDRSDYDFIREYYENDRKELADRLGKSVNSIRLRAFRIVEALRALVDERPGGRSPAGKAKVTSL